MPSAWRSEEAQVLTDALKAVLMLTDRGLDMLDAGCGTDLCGPLLRAQARRLVGVDLSSGMVAKARARVGYDELVVAQLTAYLQVHSDAYDVVVSTDTLIYFGDLSPVFAAALGALRPGADWRLRWRCRKATRTVTRCRPAAGINIRAATCSAYRRPPGSMGPRWIARRGARRLTGRYALGCIGVL